MSTKHFLGLHLTRRELDAFCGIKKLPSTHSEIRSSLHSLSKWESHLATPRPCNQDNERFLICPRVPQLWSTHADLCSDGRLRDYRCLCVHETQSRKQNQHAPCHICTEITLRNSCDSFKWLHLFDNCWVKIVPLWAISGWQMAF